MFLGTEAYAAAITRPAMLPKLMLWSHMGTILLLPFVGFHKSVKVGLCELFPADCCLIYPCRFQSGPKIKYFSV